MSVQVIRIAAGLASAIGAAAALAVAGAAAMPQDKTSRSTIAFTGSLPALDGRHLTVTVLEVTYPPGGANPAHRHPCPVIGYVLSGAVRMRLQGGQERVFKAGDSFFESPSDVHALSANASHKEPARFLAYFICDHETALSVPVPVNKEPR